MDIVAEEWRAVVGYEGFYEVSDLGRVRRVGGVFPDGRGRMRVVEGKVLCLNTTLGGYKQKSLSRDGKRTNHYIHRLVATAFLGVPATKKQVNHKNGVKDDNRPANLEWCTAEENRGHSADVLGKSFGGRGLKKKFSAEQIRGVREAAGVMTTKEISKLYGMSPTYIYRIHKGIQNPTGYWRSTRTTEELPPA